MPLKYSNHCKIRNNNILIEDHPKWISTPPLRVGPNDSKGELKKLSDHCKINSYLLAVKVQYYHNI